MDRDHGIEEDYKNEQAYHNSLSAVPRPSEGLVPRFFKGMDCPDPYTADVVYIDVTTGREVMRYDGADPANTRFDYGAKPDSECLANLGYDIKEMIEPGKAVVSHAECAKRMRYDIGYLEDF